MVWIAQQKGTMIRQNTRQVLDCKCPKMVEPTVITQQPIQPFKDIWSEPLLLLHQSICLTNKPQICQIRLRDKIAEVPRGINKGIQSATLFLMHGHITIKVS